MAITLTRLLASHYQRRKSPIQKRSLPGRWSQATNRLPRRQRRSARSRSGAAFSQRFAGHANLPDWVPIKRLTRWRQAGNSPALRTMKNLTNGKSKSSAATFCFIFLGIRWLKKSLHTFQRDDGHASLLDHQEKLSTQICDSCARRLSLAVWYSPRMGMYCGFMYCFPPFASRLRSLLHVRYRPFSASHQGQQSAKSSR